MKNQKLYFEYLVEQGFTPKIDDNDNLVFKYQSKTLVLINDEADPTYFHLRLPNFWSIDSPDELIRCLKAANKINKRKKVATVVINDKYACVVVEMFTENTPSVEDFFMRTLSVVCQAAEEFGKEMVDEPTDLLKYLFQN